MVSYVMTNTVVTNALVILTALEIWFALMERVTARKWALRLHRVCDQLTPHVCV